MNAPARLPVAGLSLTLVLAGPSGGRLLTVAQHDGMRAAKAPRTADVSADGRFVAFQSWSRLVDADGDLLLDVYVLDCVSGRVTLESGDADADTENAHARISGDGRLVVFELRRTRPEGSSQMDVLLRDRDRTTTRSLTSQARRDGAFTWSRSPDISDDGRRVAFASSATTLAAGTDMNGALEDVYVIDLPTGTISRVSLSVTGAQLATGSSNAPALSADGNVIAFASTAPLDEERSTGRATPARQIYVRDLGARATVRVSRTPRGIPPNRDSAQPSISGDGRHVVFGSDADDIVANDTNRDTDVFIFDRQTARTTHVSRGAGGAPNGTSANPTISADGRFVAFQSDAGNLVCATRCAATVQDLNLLWDVFIWDRTTERTVRVSEDELGGWMDWSAGPAIDGTGRVIAFSSRHPMDDADRGHDLDLFVRTRVQPGDFVPRTPLLARSRGPRAPRRSPDSLALARSLVSQIASSVWR
jgi:Tol biopolymer transport system component